jgi:hypothetical protein
VSVPEEKLHGVDQALSELGKSDEEISEVRHRFAADEHADLQDVDLALSTLAEGVANVEIGGRPISTEPTGAPDVSSAPDVIGEDWDNENTEVEVIDESDFVLLVDEGDLEELERVGEDDAGKTRPPAVPQEGEQGEGDEGFFKKLFGGRRTSNSPKPPNG